MLRARSKGFRFKTDRRIERERACGQKEEEGLVGEGGRKKRGMK
jgi:hypothetical protein